MLWLIILVGYVNTGLYIMANIHRARKAYRFQYVSFGRWTVRQPNGRFRKNLANVWDIASLGV